MADERQDITTQEELSICCRWLVNGCPEEHFLTVLHVKSTDAENITDALTSFISGNNLDYKKVIGQGYDGAATFSGSRTGVQRRMRVHAAHALYIHCSLPQIAACFYASSRVHWRSPEDVWYNDQPMEVVLLPYFIK